MDYRPISQDRILFDPFSEDARAFFTKNSLNPLSKEEFDKFFYDRDFSVLGVDLEKIDVPLEVEILEEEDAQSEISTEFNFNCSYDGEQLKSSKKNNLGGLDLIDDTPFDWFPHCRVEFFRSMSEFNSTNGLLENFFDSTNGFNSLFKTLFYAYRYRLFFLVY